MQAVLNAAKQGDVSHIQAAALKLAVSKGYLTEDHKLTAQGFAAVGGDYLIQVPKKVEKEVVWVTVDTKPDEAEAEATARRFSVTNANVFRVVPDGLVLPRFPVFDFGQRYVENALNGTRVATPGFVGIDSDESLPEALFIIQKRISPTFADGQQLDWELAVERRFADYEDAAQVAYEYVTAEKKDGLECRVVYADPPLPLTVYRNGQAGRPDTSAYEELVRLAAGFFLQDGTPHAEAAGILLAEWAHTPEQVRKACAAALRRIGLHELAEVISHV